jgi:NAD(P)-dependent dehydrogenase (short-subunit alcohol dehydrogenase family)
MGREKLTMGDSLKGRVAIVVGAGSVQGASDRPPIGNGKAAALLYAREGAAVMAVDIKSEAAEDTKRMIELEGGICSTFKADVCRLEDIQAMADDCIKAYGRIDILHNNVGFGVPKPGGILGFVEEDWDLVMNVNLKSVFRTCRAVLPQMLKQGNGSILNISSIAAIKHAYPELFIYSISKSAVNTLTRCLAGQLADKGIRVNAIMPGMIDSPLVYKELIAVYDGNLERMRRDRNERVPMKKMGDPWDIAYASLFLVSDQAKYITGQVLSVDGGLSVS